MRLLLLGMLVLGFCVGLAKEKEYVDISVGGKFIMRLRAGYGTMSLEERARIIEERLVKLIGEPISPEQVTLKEVRNGQRYEIYVRGQLLITVTPEDARAAKMKIKQLAEHWLKQLRENLPPISTRGSKAP